MTTVSVRSGSYSELQGLNEVVCDFEIYLFFVSCYMRPNVDLGSWQTKHQCLEVDEFKSPLSPSALHSSGARTQCSWHLEMSDYKHLASSKGTKFLVWTKCACGDGGRVNNSTGKRAHAAPSAPCGACRTAVQASLSWPLRLSALLQFNRDLNYCTRVINTEIHFNFGYPKNKSVLCNCWVCKFSGVSPSYHIQIQHLSLTLEPQIKCNMKNF